MPAKGYQMSRDNIINEKFFAQFKKDTGIVDIDYKTFKEVIVDSNKEMADVIVAGNDGMRLPKSLGAITATKYKSNKKGIDWVNSNKFGKRIYHLNLHSYGFSFAIKWFKHEITKLSVASIYKFKACRTLSRSVAAAGKESHGKQYFEWKYADFYQATKLERYLLRRNKNNDNGNNNRS